jgi:hypothetical protein
LSFNPNGALGDTPRFFAEGAAALIIFTFHFAPAFLEKKTRPTSNDQ